MRPLPSRLALIVNLLLITVLLASCDNTTVTSTPTSANPAATPATTGLVVSQNRTPTETTASSTPTPAATEPPAAPSSTDQIATAEAAGTLDHDTALLYRLYAAFDPVKVPAPYKGDDRGPGPESKGILDEISARWDSLPAAVQARAAPFFLRPSNPASFWNAPPPTVTSQGRPPGLAAQAQTTPGGPPPASPGQPPPAPAPVAWASVDSAQTRTRVWYSQQDPAQRGVATQLAGEIDASGMWASEKRAMLGRYEPCDDARLGENGGDGRLDVYLVGPGENAPRQIAPGTGASLPQRMGGDPASGVDIVPQQRASQCIATFILLNNTLDFPHIKSAMAHELFHAFQHSVSVRVLQPEYDWWKEASATWAEDLVYPPLNFEQPHLDLGGWALTRLPPGPLPCDNGNLECPYGAYIWPFYLTHRGETDSTEVGQLWAASAQQPPLRSMTDRNDWADRWKEFALWNWNEGPADKYRDNGTPITPLKQNAWDAAYTRIPRTGPPPPQPWPTSGYGSPLFVAHGTYPINLKMPGASMDYYVVGKPEQAAAQLHFDLGALAQKPGVAVQAIVTIGDPAHPDRRYVEDWSKLREKKFCLNVKEENATNVILVVSNSNTVPGEILNAQISVTALRESCPAEANMSYVADTTYKIESNSDGVVTGQATSHEDIHSNWEIALDERGNDETTYIFTATNAISLHGDANLKSVKTHSTSTTNIHVAGSGTTHNPSLPGEALAIWKGKIVNPFEMYITYPTAKGTIVTFRNEAGKDVYTIDLAVSVLQPTYTYHAHIAVNSDGGCNAPSVYDEVYDNETRTLDTTASGPCQPNTGNPHVVFDQPFLFGAIVPDRSKPNTTGAGGWISGEYDPKKGLLEGTEPVSLNKCDEVPYYDPLDFATLMAVDSADIDYDLQEVDTCTLNYTLHWSVQLPQSK